MTVITKSATDSKVEIVRTGEMRISDVPSIVFVTHSLGSCVAVAAYDPDLRLGGIVNYLLPQPSSSEVSRLHPLVYGSLAIPAFLEELCKRGAEKERLIVEIAGGSVMAGLKKYLKVGLRNREMARSIFYANGIEIAAETESPVPARSLSLEIRTGKMSVKRLVDIEVES